MYEQVYNMLIYIGGIMYVHTRTYKTERGNTRVYRHMCMNDMYSLYPHNKQADK